MRLPGGPSELALAAARLRSQKGVGVVVTAVEVPARHPARRDVAKAMEAEGMERVRDVAKDVVAVAAAVVMAAVVVVPMAEMARCMAVQDAVGPGMDVRSVAGRAMFPAAELGVRVFAHED